MQGVWGDGEVIWWRSGGDLSPGRLGPGCGAPSVPGGVGGSSPQAVWSLGKVSHEQLNGMAKHVSGGWSGLRYAKWARVTGRLEARGQLGSLLGCSYDKMGRF